MTANDEQIMTLKKKIEEKTALIGKSENFSPVTNCSLEIDGNRYNINVLDKNTLMWLIVKLTTYNEIAEKLKFASEMNLSGFKLTEWIKDLTARLAYLNVKLERERLHALESKLHNLLSVDKKIELEIKDIEESI